MFIPLTLQVHKKILLTLFGGRPVAVGYVGTVLKEPATFIFMVKPGRYITC
jgi:hypothetical protein